MTSLLSYDLKRITVPLIVLLAIGTALILLLPAPFSPIPETGYVHTAAFAFLGIVTAVVFAVRCFNDPPGVGNWILSRGLTRNAIFRSRFLTGIVGILILAAAMATLCFLGVREFVQGEMGNGVWYPTVRLGELHVVRDFTIVAIASFCAAVLFGSLTSISKQSASRFSDGIHAFASFLAVAAFGGAWQVLLTSASPEIPLSYSLIGFVVITAVMTASALFACVEQEVLN